MILSDYWRVQHGTAFINKAMLKINESIMIPKEKESQDYLLQIQLLMENEVNFAGMRGLFTMISSRQSLLQKLNYTLSLQKEAYDRC